MNVFLSASVPLPNRDQRYYKTSDVVAIRDAVKSLVIEATRSGTVTFGGHPAITPLISSVIKQTLPDRAQSFKLFQSEYFFRYFPQENDEFIDVRITAAIDDDREKSLQYMRERMLTHCEYSAAFFIGGMEGVTAEYDMLRMLQPSVPVYPVASTGGASLEIYDQLIARDPDLLNQLTYPTLFRKLLTKT